MCCVRSLLTSNACDRKNCLWNINFCAIHSENAGRVEILKYVINFSCFILYPNPSFFLAFDFCRFCVVIRFFHPRHNGQWPPTLQDFYTNLIHYIIFPVLILEKEPVFSLFNVTTGTIFITSLVWGGPWLGIEPGTSRTRSQHSTTRLSPRRYPNPW